MKYLIIGSVALIAIGCFSKEPTKTGFEGKLIPSFELLLADSISKINTKDINSDKSFIFFYFSPRCPYSKAQMDEIIESKDQLKGITFYIITPEPFNEMKRFYEEYELNKYSNFITGADYSDFFGRYYEVKGYPYLSIYDKEKRLKKVFLGKVASSQIKNECE